MDSWSASSGRRRPRNRCRREYTTNCTSSSRLSTLSYRLDLCLQTPGQVTFPTRVQEPTSPCLVEARRMEVTDHTRQLAFPMKENVSYSFCIFSHKKHITPGWGLSDKPAAEPLWHGGHRGLVQRAAGEGDSANLQHPAPAHLPRQGPQVTITITISLNIIALFITGVSASPPALPLCTVWGAGRGSSCGPGLVSCCWGSARPSRGSSAQLSAWRRSGL